MSELLFFIWSSIHIATRNLYHLLQNEFHRLNREKKEEIFLVRKKNELKEFFWFHRIIYSGTKKDNWLSIIICLCVKNYLSELLHTCSGKLWYIVDDQSLIFIILLSTISLLNKTNAAYHLLHKSFRRSRRRTHVFFLSVCSTCH
jgi:hypothetical protein